MSNIYQECPICSKKMKEDRCDCGFVLAMYFDDETKKHFFEFLRNQKDEQGRRQAHDDKKRQKELQKHEESYIQNVAKLLSDPGKYQSADSVGLSPEYLYVDFTPKMEAVSRIANFLALADNYDAISQFFVMNNLVENASNVVVILDKLAEWSKTLYELYNSSDTSMKYNIISEGKKVIAQLPRYIDNSKIYFKMARTCRRNTYQGDKDIMKEAIEYFEKSKLDDASLNYYVGTMYYRVGDNCRAVEYLDKNKEPIRSTDYYLGVIYANGLDGADADVDKAAMHLKRFLTNANSVGANNDMIFNAQSILRQCSR